LQVSDAVELHGDGNATPVAGRGYRLDDMKDGQMRSAAGRQFDSDMGRLQ
jgi:hypothetical protein